MTVGERERAFTAAPGGTLRVRAVVMDGDDVRRAIWRIAHEIIERNHGAQGLVLIGLQTGGAWVASALAEVIRSVAEVDVPVGTLDVAYYRDDIGLRPVVPAAPTEIPVEVDGATVVLCDDVLFTGRTVRAALNALYDHGRPAAVQLAVMVDRGHRELPLRPDYVGKNLPTRRDEVVDVSEAGVVLAEAGPATGAPVAETGGQS
ncbi:MAG: bifunctional pyr operon transcriptional regulator/uracil phosphoribosyltransferase PyrR [Acidimicrobiales bacterium]